MLRTLRNWWKSFYEWICLIGTDDEGIYEWSATDLIAMTYPLPAEQCDYGNCNEYGSRSE